MLDIVDVRIIEEQHKEIEKLANELEEQERHIKEADYEIERLNNIINRTTKYVQSLSSKGRDCDIYEDIKQEILKELKGDSSNDK